MKIEKLNDDKIRIILDINELEKNNVDFLSLTKNTKETQKLFKEILKQAETEVDFYAGDCKLLIEAFISADGFFIITFTKITPEKDVPIGMSARIKIKNKKAIKNYNDVIYEFNSIDDFFEFYTYFVNNKIRETTRIAKKISLYQYKEKYFLILYNIDKDNKNLFRLYASINEFAKLTSNSEVFSSMISEYGKKII